MQLARAKSLLVVTAHPDDETLFFAPSILGVLDEGSTRGGLLVMSNGELIFHSLFFSLKGFGVLGGIGVNVTKGIIMGLVK